MFSCWKECGKKWWLPIPNTVLKFEETEEINEDPRVRREDLRIKI
jgi:hypothetical protein